MQVCLGKVKETHVDAYASGFGNSGGHGENRDRVACWTDAKGPAKFTKYCIC